MIINPTSINIIKWKMAGVSGKNRGKRKKRSCLTGNESETRKQIFRDKRTTKEKNARGAGMNQIWESRHVLTGRRFQQRIQ